MKRQDWLAWRRLGLGGSDVAAIRAGRDWEVWLSKVHGIDVDLTDEAVETGRRLEDVIARWAATELGADLKRDNGLITHDEQWRRASLDAWLAFPEGAAVGLECKVNQWPDDELPPAWLDQVRWYMATCDVDRWIVAAFHRCAPAWRIYQVDRDAEAEDLLVMEARAWWTRHVVEGVPPEVDGTAAASQGLGLLRDRPVDGGGLEGVLEVATDEELELVLEYIETDRVVKDLDLERKRLRNHVRAAIGDRPGLRWTGGRVKWGASRVTYRTDEPDRR